MTARMVVGSDILMSNFSFIDVSLVWFLVVGGVVGWSEEWLQRSSHMYGPSYILFIQLSTLFLGNQS
jgi:hypothetical protein